MNSEKRKLIKSTDFFIIGILALVCIAAILFIKLEGSKVNNVKAQISYNGKVVKEIDLTKAEDCVFKLDENENVSFQISKHKIRFVDTKCPDKICEKSGYLEKANSVAICLPNKVSLKLIGSKEQVDIVVN